MLRVQGSFGLARHMGQRTDSMCRGVSFATSTPVLFNIADLRSWSILLLNDCNRPKWELSVTSQPFWELERNREIWLVERSLFGISCCRLIELRRTATV